MRSPRRMLFRRDYRRLTGGHLKVHDYLGHARSSGAFEPAVYLTPESRRDGLWDADCVVDRFDPGSADVLFLGGRDWEALAPFGRIEERVPVINLIQHVSHADPGDPKFAFLSRRAVRICVSEAVRDAIAATGLCNGPLHVIPGGIDLAALRPRTERDVDVFIAGWKQPLLARELGTTLARRWRVDIVDGFVDREAFLDRLARARVAVLLPRETEGLFLPALEAMALDCAVVCPDCIGNRGACIDGVTCLMPAATAPELAAAAERLLEQPVLSAALRGAARDAVRRFDLVSERAAFHRLLETV